MVSEFQGPFSCSARQPTCVPNLQPSFTVTWLSPRSLHLLHPLPASTSTALGLTHPLEHKAGASGPLGCEGLHFAQTWAIITFLANCKFEICSPGGVKPLAFLLILEGEARYAQHIIGARRILVLPSWSHFFWCLLLFWAACPCFNGTKWPFSTLS